MNNIHNQIYKRARMKEDITSSMISKISRNTNTVYITPLPFYWHKLTLGFDIVLKNSIQLSLSITKEFCFEMLREKI